MSYLRKTHNRLIRILGLVTVAVFGILSTLGTGGGGGGDSGGVQPLTYSGNTEPAIITVDNAPTLVANVLYGGSSATNIPTAVSTASMASRSAGAIVVVDYLRTVMQYSLTNLYDDNLIGSDIVTGFTVNEPIYCDSGSANLTGQLSDFDGTGTLTFTYDNCILDGVTYNGTGTFRVDYFDFSYLYPTDATMSFNLMSISSSEFNGSISGSIRMETLFGTNTIRMTLNYIAKDNSTNKMYKFENCLVTAVFDNIYLPSTLSITFNGSPARVYDSIHGYVDVVTLTPLLYSSVNLTYPDSDGLMLFYGQAPSSIRLTVLSENHVLLELDIDNIGGFEIVNYLLWEELATNANTDLTDTDGDGMHDSWETTYGLDPNLDDSADDLDLDTFSNLTEYQAGTNPNDAASHP